jgi:hypothetical protein
MSGRLYVHDNHSSAVDEEFIDQIIRFSLAGFAVLALIAIGIIGLSVLL